ncbi:hypothetical protein JFJ08_07885 [Vibrio atlanticus]|uniref:hypothetical protein n=1 Tax=Vibrio sp. 10N.261.46.A3 TaxID=3229658 RepID=UPI00354FDE4C|nr:hypothetical protein [Vibrio atlanticus]
MGLYKDMKTFRDGIYETGHSMHDNSFVLKVETRIRQKGDNFINYDFYLTYNLFVLMSWLSLFLGYPIIRFYFPETDIGKLQYTMFHDLDNINLSVFGSAVKAAFCAFLYTCVTFTLFGLCMAIKHGSVRLFFDFLGQSFYQGYKSGVFLGILFFFILFT